MKSYSMWPFATASLTQHVSKVHSFAVCIHILFIHLLVDRHFGGFHLLTTMNIMLLQTFVYSFFRAMFSFLLGMYLGEELLCCMVTLCFIVWRTAILSFKADVSFYIPISIWRFEVLNILTYTCYNLTLFLAHSSGIKRYLIVVWLHFPDN